MGPRRPAHGRSFCSFFVLDSVIWLNSYNLHQPSYRMQSYRTLLAELPLGDSTTCSSTTKGISERDLAFLPETSFERRGSS